MSNEVVDSTQERPLLRIEALEINDLRSIKRLRWPEDGIGWAGRIPDIVVVAGANGSGKTTLLEEIFNTIDGTIKLSNQLNSVRHQSHLYKTSTLKNSNIGNAFSIFDLTINKKIIKNLSNSSIYDLIENTPEKIKTKIIYFKSKRKNPSFSSKPKQFQTLNPASQSFYIWDDKGSSDLSIEDIFYSARWEDANAILNGRPEKATKFKFYADEFEKFTEGEKRLVWTDGGELLVETRDGVRHDVNEMSSGEHQALIFSIMLSRWWAPGSIILIDEPELHLHTHWQAKLLQRIIDLQKERGGQAILATQSSELFSMAPAGSQVLLGGW